MAYRWKLSSDKAAYAAACKEIAEKGFKLSKSTKCLSIYGEKDGKERFYQNLHEVFTSALKETGDFDIKNYKLWINEHYYDLLEKENSNFIRIKHPKTDPMISKYLSGYVFENKNIIMTTKETNYFYLEYSKNNGESIKFRPKTF